MKKTLKSTVLGIVLLASVLILWACVEPTIEQDTYYLINEFGSAPIYVEGKAEPGNLSGDYPGVARVAQDLKQDIFDTTGKQSVVTDKKSDLLGKENIIIIGSIEKSQLIMELAESGKIDISVLQDKWESYIIEVVKDPFNDGRVKRALIIAGSDKRGTIFGTYKISEMLGVSPWKFFGDNVASTIENFELPGDYYLHQEEPTVQYRGIFINDEEELAAWSQQFDEGKSMGPNMYEHIFELLLRLNANYIWPAMHGASDAFNDHFENPQLADYFGIVVGTSHVDMMLRNNNNEWNTFVANYRIEHNYSAPIEYDYTVNPEILQEYWRSAVEMNKDYEVQYTLGMRAIHDEPLPAKNINQAPWYGDRVALMENIIEDQRQILREVLDNPTLEDVFMVFTPYKEVQEIYNQGLELPDDVTIIWVNDNHGYIRQLPNAQERERSGGNGLYYHNSYWGPDNESYMWLNSMPHAFFRQELSKAIDYKTTKNWILNVGDIVPGHTSLAYFLAYAYDAKRYDGEHVYDFAYDFGKNEFGVEFAEDVQGIIRDYGLFTHIRKLEMMAVDLFTTTAFSDEYEKHMSRYQDLLSRAEDVYDRLPEHKKAAFYLMVLYQVRSAYNYNAQFYYATKANSAVVAGKDITAYNSYHQSVHYYQEQMYENSYFNDVVSDGKWSGILEPNYYLPPVAPGIAEGGFALETYPYEGGVIVEGEQIEQDDSTLTFGNFAEGRKFIDIFAKGTTGISYQIISSQDWLTLSKSNGHTYDEDRIWVEVDFDLLTVGNHEATITVNYEDYSKNITVFVSKLDLNLGEKTYIEQDGYLSIEAEHYSNLRNNHVQTWEILMNLGRVSGDMMRTTSASLVGTSEFEYLEKGAYLEYNAYFLNAGVFDMEVFRLPTLNANGRLRFAIQVNDLEPQIIEGQLDAEVGNLDWQFGLFNQIFKHRLEIEIPETGLNRIRVYSIDPYLVFDKFVIYTEGYEPSYLGPDESFNTTYNNQPTSTYYENYYQTQYLPEVDYDLKDEWGQGYIVEQNNRLLIETEYAAEESTYAFTTNPTNDGWILTSHLGGLSMRTKENNINYTGLHQSAPTLNYQVGFNNTGQYRVWVRYDAPHPSANSFGFGVNGLLIFEVNGGLYSYNNEESYLWKNVGTMSVSQTGIQTIQIYAMQDGFSIDKIYLTKGSENPENGVTPSLRMTTFDSQNQVLTTDEIMHRGQLQQAIQKFGGLFTIAQGEVLGSMSSEMRESYLEQLNLVYSLYNNETALYADEVTDAVENLEIIYQELVDSQVLTDGSQNYLLYQDFSLMTQGYVPFGIHKDLVVGDAFYKIVEENNQNYLSVRTFHENRTRLQSALLSYDFKRMATSELVVETRMRYNEARWGNMIYILNEIGQIAVSVAFENSNGPTREIVAYNGNNKVVVGHFEYDAWVDLKVVANVESNTFQLYVNGILIPQTFGFRNQTLKLATYQFGVQNAVHSRLDLAYVKAYETADRVITDIDELLTLINFNQPEKFQTELTWSMIPSGYELAINSTSNPNIITLDGLIKPDLVDQIVEVDFVLTQLSNNESRNLNDIEIFVPGVTVNESKLELTIAINQIIETVNSLPIGQSIGTFDANLYAELSSVIEDANTLKSQTTVYYNDVQNISHLMIEKLTSLESSRLMSEVVNGDTYTYYAYDNFDHYTDGASPFGLTNTGTGIFTSSLVKEVDNGYFAYTTGAPGNITNYLSWSEALSGTVYVEVKVKDLTNSASQFTNLIYLMNQTDNNKYAIAVAFERSSGQTYLQYHNGAGWQRTGNLASNVYSIGTEVVIKLEISIELGTYSIFMDDELIYENVSFRAPEIRQDITRLMFGSSRQNESVMYDYISIYSMTEGGSEA